MYAKPTSPQSIGQVLDGSFRLTAASYKHTWIFALLTGLASYAASAYQFTRGPSIVQSITAPQDAVYWTLYCAGVLLSILFMAAIYVRVDAIAGGSAEERSAMSVALSRWPLLVVTTILYGLAVAVGMVLLIIPGIILAFSLVLSTAILLFEGKGPVDALTSSHRLVWGHWWRTFVILAVGGIIAIVLYIILGIVAGALAPMFSGGDAAVAGLISMLLVLAFAGVIMTPFFVALLLNIYWDLKLRKEGGDLVARAQAA